MMRRAAFLLVLLLTVTITAQETCPDIVKAALTALDTVCEGTGRNQLCYGNQQISITTNTREAVPFDAPGDRAPVTAVETIALSALLQPDTWGLGLMKIQANIPDTLPGQNVTFLLFGDVRIEGSEPMPTLRALTTGGINVRSGPSRNASLVTGLNAGVSLELIGRNHAADWVYFRAEDAQGWLYAPLIQIEGDVSVLAVVADDYQGATYGPMQAFYFHSGINDSPCAEAPDSGILIQTPGEAGSIELLINDTRIELGSTAYLQAEAGHALWVYVLEGAARVSVEDVTQVVPAGAFTTVPLDDSLRAWGSPATPLPYEADTGGALPVAQLEEAIVVAEPASDDIIIQANSCKLTLAADALLRSGPGREYPVIHGGQAGRDYPVSGYAIREDGQRWWQFSLYGSSFWVGSEAVPVSGNCANIAELDIPPAPSGYVSSQAVAVRGMGSRFNLWDCNGGIQRVPSGTSIEIFISHGGGDNFASLQEALNARYSSWMEINGVSYSVVRTGGFTDGIGHHHTVHFNVGVLPDGTYRARGQINGFPIPSCLVVVG